ncbi:MAG: hypothetical protein ABII01_05070 [Candidatus Woesearchaeota archaeon]
MWFYPIFVFIILSAIVIPLVPAKAPDNLLIQVTDKGFGFDEIYCKAYISSDKGEWENELVDDINLHENMGISCHDRDKCVNNGYKMLRTDFGYYWGDYEIRIVCRNINKITYAIINNSNIPEHSDAVIL